MSHFTIHLRKRLDGRRSAWFEDPTLTRPDDGDTLLTGPLRDRATPHGVLARRPGATTRDVPGLGEGVHQLTMLRGDLHLIVSASGPGTEAGAAATRLAGAALARPP